MANLPGHIFEEASDNLSLVAEAMVQMTAQGNVSVSTFQKAASALDFLNKKQEMAWKLNDQMQKQADKDLKDKQKQQQTLKQLSSSMTVFFAATSAGVMSMVRAASPSLFSGFTGSLELLAGTVGQSLIPAFVEVTDFILNLVDEWNELSDSTKELISNSALAVAGGVAVAVMLGHAASAMMTLGSAVRALIAAAVAHPILAIVTVLTAAAAAMGLFTAAAEALQDAMNRAEKNIQGLDRALEKIDSHKPLTEKDLSAFSAEERKRLMETRNNPAEQKKVLEDIRDRAKKDLANAPDDATRRKREAAMEAAIHESFSRKEGIRSRRERMTGALMSTGMEKEEAEKMARAFTDAVGVKLAMNVEEAHKALGMIPKFMGLPAEEAQARASLAGEGLKQGGINVLTKEEERKLRKKEREVDHLRTMIGHNKEMAPSFTAIDQARKNFQLAAFKDPIEQKKLQMQRQSYDTLRKLLQRSEDQLAVLRKHLGLKSNPLLGD